MNCVITEHCRSVSHSLAQIPHLSFPLSPREVCPVRPSSVTIAQAKQLSARAILQVPRSRPIGPIPMDALLSRG